MTERDETISDFTVLEAMATYGGGFVKGLATLYRLGDEDNQRRIKTTWPEYWEKYTEMARYLQRQP